MFSRETYACRRAALRRQLGKGLVLFFGNNESPYNYPANSYTPMRQDSSFLYFFGQHRDGLVGVIDIDNDKEVLYGDDVDIEDIVWLGTVGSVATLAAQVGVAQTAPLSELRPLIAKAQAHGQEVHFLPPYRYDTKIFIMDLLGIHPQDQTRRASQALIDAVVTLRSTKSDEEIASIDRACDVGYKMHTCAMSLCAAGVKETFIGGQIDGTALSYAQGVSFPTICSQHGEIMHGAPKMVPLESGRLLLVDAGCELDDYCSDNTRTMPVSGTFTQQQREVYDIVVGCHDLVLEVAKPGVKWMDVHFAVCRQMVDGLKALGLMRGDTAAAVASGAHALFLPHGLGHMMGMDVHDMEGLGQVYVGFDAETRPMLDQFGTNALRMGRRLQEGFVVTDEPGIYFIPDLIDEWKSKHLYEEYINYSAIEKYRSFGGIRIEDDLLITDTGCRFLGTQRIPYHVADVEEFMSQR